MKEIDFDELDRAVNSLMAPKGEKATKTTVEPVEETSEEPAVATSEAETATVTEPASDDTSADATSADDADSTASKESHTVITRSPGRFIDVIRPTATSSSDASRPAPSRSRPAIAPSASFEKAMSKVEEPTVRDSGDDDIDDVVDAPESPFISDAKVDKRPLGGSDDSEVFVSPAPLPSHADASQALVPDELKSDVLSVESGGIVEEEEVDEPAPTDEAATKDQAVPSSIAPQYKAETESKLPEEHTPLYSPATTDVGTKSARKKSPWKTILLVVILLALGVLAGLAAYTMNLFR